MKRVAVLRGGPSEEYAVSMKSGRAVLDALNVLGYPYKDIVITKQGEWLEQGVIRVPDNALDAVDMVFIALHGSYGEDGQIQRILQRKHIPFTGSRAMPSAIAFNKELTKRSLVEHGIKMPKHLRVSKDTWGNIEELVEGLYAEMDGELFIKPVANGSSLGAKYIPNKETLLESLPMLLELYDQLLVEEFIRGREATVGVLEDFRNESLYVLPVIEIVPPGGTPLFSHENKYDGTTEEIVPGRFSYHEKSQLSDMAAAVHRAIGCDHYSRSDFIVRDGEVYFLEINTLPGLTDQSLFPKAAAAVGLDFNALIRHLVETAKV